MRLAFSAALLALACALPAAAQPLHGFYAQGEAGLDLPSAQPFETIPPADAATGQSGPTTADRAEAATTGSSAPSAGASLGYGLGNGLRVEVQGIHVTGAPHGG